MVCLCKSLPSVAHSSDTEGDVGLELGRQRGADGSIVRLRFFLLVLLRWRGSTHDALRELLLGDVAWLSSGGIPVAAETSVATDERSALLSLAPELSSDEDCDMSDPNESRSSSSIAKSFRRSLASVSFMASSTNTHTSGQLSLIGCCPHPSRSSSQAATVPIRRIRPAWRQCNKVLQAPTSSLLSATHNRAATAAAKTQREISSCWSDQAHFH